MGKPSHFVENFIGIYRYKSYHDCCDKCQHYRGPGFVSFKRHSYTPKCSLYRFKFKHDEQYHSKCKSWTCAEDCLDEQNRASWLTRENDKQRIKRRA